MSTATHPSTLSLLKAPGFGLLTVSTGAREAQDLFKKNFRRRAPESWADDLALPESGPVLIGVPSDAGGGICRGAAHGPVHLRRHLYAADKRWCSADLGDIPCVPQLSHDSLLSNAAHRQVGTALWGHAYAAELPVSPTNLLQAVLVDLWSQAPNVQPVILGGDHSLSGGVFAALHATGRDRKLAVLHVDAHTDLLESRYGIEHCFGTWTAHAVKGLENPAAWVQIGIRASGRDAAHWESTFGLKQYWAKPLRKRDPKTFAAELTRHWQSLGCERLYITNDIDGTDSKFVPATGTPEGEGLDPAWLRTVFRELTRTWPLVGTDLMEVAPVLGAPAGAERTLKTAVRYLEAIHWEPA